MGSLLAKIAWQPALIHKGLWPLIGLHQKLTGDPLAASSFVTRLPVDPILVEDSGGKVTPPPSALMKVPAGVSYWLLKNSSKHPEWPSFLVGGPGKASGYFYLLRCFLSRSLVILTAGLLLYAHLLIDQGLMTWAIVSPSQASANPGLRNLPL